MPAVGAALSAGTMSGAHIDVIGRALRQLEPRFRPHLTSRAVQVAAWRHGPPPTSSNGPWRPRSAPSNATRGWPASNANDEPPDCAPGSTVTACGASRAASIPRPASASTAGCRPRSRPCSPTRSPSIAPPTRSNVTASSTPTPWSPSPRQRPVAGEPEVVVVIDTTDPDADGTPAVDWGLPVELPDDVLRRLFDVADINPVVVHHGAVIHTPGQLNLGRTHPAGQPGPTPRPARPLPDLCHPWLPGPLRALPPPPRPVVGTRRTRPTSTTSSPCASCTTTPSTTNTGSSPSPPTASSPSPTPTAPPNTPDPNRGRPSRLASPPPTSALRTAGAAPPTMPLRR